MLFRFCRLCYNSVHSSFRNFPRHYARAFAKNRRKEIEINDDEATSTKEMIPIITCKRKTYNFYKGQVYSKNERVTLASKGWRHRDSRGDHFFIHPFDNEEVDNQSGFETFDDFNLIPSLCSHLEKLDIKKPLEIQQSAIPTIFKGYNTVLAAETGCGKTLAYLLPMINRVLQWKFIIERDQNCPLGLIVTPTRELAVQIALELIRLSKHLDIQTKLITGGKTKKMMMNPPVEHVDILVGSFGVISKLTTVGVYNLTFVRYVVLDEADALFHYTFKDKLKVFMKRLPIGYHQEFDENGFPKSAQLILASATVPSYVDEILDNIVNVDSLKYIKTAKLHKIMVEQKFVRVGSDDKPQELLKYIKSKVSKNQRVIVFCNTSGTSYWLYLFLNECGIKTTNLNGTMPLFERRGKYGEFLNGKAMVLSTTNAGSRGLDTVMVNHVLNYDFPLDTASYIHRCGRTLRKGTIGHCRVTNFICKPLEISLVQKIEYSVRKMKPLPMVNYGVPDMDVDDMMEEKDEPMKEEIIDNVENVENIPY
ncbi:probable ATP-dependent RNA helicase DDX28 [Colletes gigas]|uniref:probable ATP-dependent RNA helicase DDX28 n=1 Tax=Colletes gigas TaxID=935657 RepID=UPI001C9A3EAB|nr:probable ATP-dependent RNA helicase DDX28 [Colletes gigas]